MKLIWVIITPELLFKRSIIFLLWKGISAWPLEDQKIIETARAEMINPLFYGKLVVNIVSDKSSVSVAVRSFGLGCTEGNGSTKIRTEQ